MLNIFPRLKSYRIARSVRFFTMKDRIACFLTALQEWLLEREDEDDSHR
ncbi:MAG TPA: hypothetical protein VE842_13325 [Pyrinomonadaceae bacterium]|nr:hypothetical protein [Pyrinomonadaceae bacterium]